MSTELWQRAREVFAEVAELPAEHRAEALRNRSADSAEVRAAATELLEKYEESAASPTLLSVGEVVEKRFRVRRLVGRGGMGEVYLCDDSELGQPVALKALKVEGAGGADATVRFRREIQLARRVTHPNVCRVFEFGRHNGPNGPIDYYTMEYVDGETLAELLERKGPLTVEEAQPLVEQIAAGLGALHEREIVHRDFKPGNVLIERRGESVRVVLTDFGIAGATGRQAEIDSFVTLGNQIMGTPEYMAPEQLSGLAAGPATDLFGFGAVLYEMLTGQRPFPDQSHRTKPPLSPRTHNKEIPLSWELLILDCLQADITKRPQSAAEVVDAIGGAPRQRNVDASTAPTIALQKPRERRRWWKFAFFAAAVALAALGLRFNSQEPAPAGGRRVAVLPFVAATDDPGVRALADGLMQTITSRLSQYESLNEQLLVVPASEVRKVGVEHADKARGALGANYAVEGRLTAQGERIRLILTLIDAEEMVQQETAVINGVRANALDLEDEAVTRLATLLDLHALPTQVESIASVAPGAQEFYLQGTGYLQRSDELESVENAIQLFEKAIERDADYAMAHAGLSKAYLYKRDRTLEPDWIMKADGASRRAVELRPDLLETQTARGSALVAQGRFGEAIGFFEAALELNPRSEEAYAGLGSAYEDMAKRAKDPAEKQRKRDQAEAAFRKAISLRPNDWVTYKRLALFYGGTGRYHDAIEQYKIVTDLAPDNAHAFTNLGIASHLAGDDIAAERYLRKTLELDPDRPSALRALATLLGESGDHAGAAEIYLRAVEHNENDHNAWSNLAGAYRALGRHEVADDAYQRAILLLHKRIDVEGESDSAHAFLAHHYACVGDFVSSRKHALVAIDSDDPSDQVNIAIAFVEEGDVTAARAAAKKALDKGFPLTHLERIQQLQPILPIGN